MTLHRAVSTRKQLPGRAVSLSAHNLEVDSSKLAPATFEIWLTSFDALAPQTNHKGRRRKTSAFFVSINEIRNDSALLGFRRSPVHFELP